MYGQIATRTPANDVTPASYHPELRRCAERPAVYVAPSGPPDPCSAEGHARRSLADFDEIGRQDRGDGTWFYLVNCRECGSTVGREPVECFTCGDLFLGRAGRLPSCGPCLRGEKR